MSKDNDVKSFNQGSSVIGLPLEKEIEMDP